jgi:rubrerythrin
MEKTHFESAEDILQFAIEREEDAYNFYNEWAGKVKNPAIGEMLIELSKQELGHKKKLENLKIKGSLMPSDNKITDLKIADYLVDIPPSEDMDYQQALTLAMHREQASVNLYKMLAKLAPNDEIQDIFLNLVEEEVHHKARLEDEYDENILRDN